jgi:aryl-alcohol dehydrogenase-like predicted oxidoreductase
MKQVRLGEDSISSSALGFGCAALLGRAGRLDSLRALEAAFEAGITFYDTARSYGYGESEALLGEFLRGRRHKVVISTKFGILPAKTNVLKETIKPLARKVLQALPSARKAVHRQISAQFSANNFSVAVLRDSLETSLTKLRTDYVDLLFMHSAPADALERRDLLAELSRLVTEGKVRRAGISADAEVIELALEKNIPSLKTFQFPCNVFDLGIAHSFAGSDRDTVAVANHPFGGVRRVAESKERLRAIATDDAAPPDLRDKLRVIDNAVLAEIVLNAITDGTGIQVVVPSMIQPEHLRTNVAAMEQNRFTSAELAWIRNRLSAPVA